MASAKIVLFVSKKLRDGYHPVLLRIIIGRKPAYYNIGGTIFKCLKEEWDFDKCCFNRRFHNYQISNRNLHKTLGKAESILCDLQNDDPNFSHSDFKKLFLKKNKKIYLFKYFDEIIVRLQETGKIGNCEVYKTTRNALSNFIGSEIEMTGIDQKKLSLFIESCEKKGLRPNSISNYLRTLRAVFNKAIKEEGLEYYPFKGFNWSKLKNKTEKRAISKTEMIQMISFECESDSSLYQAREFFAFMYLTYGLNFSDLAKIEKGSIIQTEGTQVLTYNRSKGGRLYQIPLDPNAIKIIEFFKKTSGNSKYVFPVLNEDIHVTPQQIKTRIQTALKKFNSDLRIIAENLRINKHITSYVCRHSFASVLAKEGTNLWTIGEMLGHSNLNTTQIYLKELDFTEKIEACKKLIN